VLVLWKHPILWERQWNLLTGFLLVSMILTIYMFVSGMINKGPQMNSSNTNPIWTNEPTNTNSLQPKRNLHNYRTDCH
jgi:hypothetical protein